MRRRDRFCAQGTGARGKSDFTPAELAEVARLRRQLDVEGTYRLIAASDARLRAAEPDRPGPPLDADLRKRLYVGT